MGCVECKICKQEEDKSQFEYSNEAHQKIQNNLDNSIKENDNFIKEFDEKIQYIGQYIPEKEFEEMIPQILSYNIMQDKPFPYKKNYKNAHNMRPVEFENGNIYYGQWNEDFEMEGYGKYYLKEEKVLAEGVWEKGELKVARIYYPNGDFYEGELMNSTYNGKGRLILSNKDEYIGDFVDMEKEGEGEMKYADDGTIYKGGFRKNFFNGHGNMKWANGTEYNGNFVDNYFEGEGVLFNDEGEKYEGNFEKNLFHGKGKYTYSNGDIYEGDFEYGIRKGRGIYRKNGMFIFEGLWDNNVPNGYGKITIRNKIIKCNYHNGRFIDDKIYKDEPMYNGIDFHFYNEEMNLSAQKLSHIENIDVSSSQYRAGTKLSFLDDQ